MKQHLLVVFLSAGSMVAVAQPTIGGGACSSSTLNGTYAITLAGRGVTAASTQFANAEGATRNLSQPAQLSGSLTSVIDAVGSATFDGLSKANFSLNTNTNSASGGSLSWSGTYTIQANCAASVTITSGGTATLNVMSYNGGNSLALTGSDGVYAYNGTASLQATGCSTSTLMGQYAVVFSGGYYGAASGTAGGAATATGVATFDGAGNVTTTTSLAGNGLLLGITGVASNTLSGSYSLGTNCIGNGSISNALLGTLNFNISVYNGNTTLSQQMYIILASPTPKLMSTGTLFWIGQPQSTPQAGGVL